MTELVHENVLVRNTLMKLGLKPYTELTETGGVAAALSGEITIFKLDAKKSYKDLDFLKPVYNYDLIINPLEFMKIDSCERPKFLCLIPLYLIEDSDYYDVVFSWVIIESVDDFIIHSMDDALYKRYNAKYCPDEPTSNLPYKLVHDHITSGLLYRKISLLNNAKKADNRYIEDTLNYFTSKDELEVKFIEPSNVSCTMYTGAFFESKPTMLDMHLQVFNIDFFHETFDEKINGVFNVKLIKFKVCKPDVELMNAINTEDLSNGYLLHMSGYDTDGRLFTFMKTNVVGIEISELYQELVKVQKKEAEQNKISLGLVNQIETLDTESLHDYVKTVLGRDPDSDELAMFIHVHNVLMGHYVNDSLVKFFKESKDLTKDFFKYMQVCNKVIYHSYYFPYRQNVHQLMNVTDYLEVFDYVKTLTC